jgi:hypothetical protein
MAKITPYYFIGYQEFKDTKFGLYNLTQDFVGHPTGSTVSEATLKELGIWQICKCSIKAGLCVNHKIAKGD